MADDLEARIAATEAVIAAREQRLAVRAADLARRTRALTEPRHWAGRAGGMALVLLAGTWLWRRLGGTAPPPAPHAHPDDVPWLHWLPLVWPLLPVRWRSRISLGTATTVAAFAAPIVAAVFGRRRPPSPPPEGKP